MNDTSFSHGLNTDETRIDSLFRSVLSLAIIAFRVFRVFRGFQTDSPNPWPKTVLRTTHRNGWCPGACRSRIAS